MNRSFEVHLLHFVVCIVIHEFHKLFQLEGNMFLNGVPEIKGFSAEVVSEKTLGDKRIVHLKILPANWPKNCFINIRLDYFNYDWVPVELTLYYPDIIDYIIEFNCSGKPNYSIKLHERFVLDKFNKFIKKELVN